MDRKRECVFLCSRRATSDTSATLYHKCRMQRRDGNGDRVKVADAARATSAAPTYFSHVKLHNKQYLVDGGFGETNNPSKAAWDHYFSMRIHDYEQVNVINIGTGSEPEGYKRKKGWTDALPTSILRGFVHTIKGLAKLATESDAVGYDMKLIQSSGAKALNFSRFSANIGELHNIHLYEYQRQSDIIKLTEQYLGSSEVQSDLSNVAARLANSYRARNPEMFRTGHDTVPHTISQAGADIPNAPRRTSAAEPSERNEDITSDTSSITTSSHSGALGGQDAPYPRGQASAHPPSIFDRSLLSAPQSTPLTSINTSRRSSLAGGSPADRTKDTLPTSAHIGNTRDAGTAFT